jgi:dihydrofolate reductase
MINLIAAIDLNRGLGFNNDLLVKLPNDMKHFKN